MRIEPPPSVPMANGVTPAATLAAAPALEPPAVDARTRDAHERGRHVAEGREPPARIGRIELGRSRRHPALHGAHDAAIEELLRLHLVMVQGELAQRPRGKYVQIACFDAPPPDKQTRPIAVLSWKDWKADAPSIHYPRRGGASRAPSRAAAPRRFRVAGADPT